MKAHVIQGIRHLRKAGTVVLILYSVTSISASGALENDSTKTRTRLDKLEQQLKEKQAGYEKAQLTVDEDVKLIEEATIDDLIVISEDGLSSPYFAYVHGWLRMDLFERHRARLYEAG